MFYSTGVTNELVRTLGLSDKTPPGLPGLKPSSNSILPVAWITRPATDLRQGLSISSLLNKHEVVKVISQSLKITTTNTRIYSTSWQLPNMNNVATTNFEKNLLTRKL